MTHARSLMIVLGALAALSFDARAANPGSLACPSGSIADLPKERAARELAAEHPLARASIARVAKICFAPGEGGITPQAIAIIPPDLGPRGTAARAAHLGHHRLPGSPLVGTPDRDCTRWVTRAIEEEDRAHALEDAILAREPEKAGAPYDRDSLVRAYRAQCEARSQR